MFKASALVFLHAETAVHAGSGQSFGAIDLAIQRERHTDFPVIAASGVKGAVRDWFEKHADFGRGNDRVKALFGPDTKHASEHAGAVSFTDARTLLFPVRSATGVYALTTCPAALARLARDLALAGAPPLPAPIAALAVPRNEARITSASSLVDEGSAMLEEYVFRTKADAAVDELANWLAQNAFPQSPEYDALRRRLGSHLLVLSDDDFTDFVRHTTEVQARVALNSQKTTTGDGGNLFYQENLPADTVLYAAALAGDSLMKDHVASAREMLGAVATLDAQRLQLGGDETVGKGICCTRFLHGTRN